MQMTLKEIGEALKQERLNKSIPAEEVMRRTKISRRNFEALEAGDAAELPHLVYVKGFVRTYAKVVGLDGEELAARLVEACGNEECSAGQPGEQDVRQAVIPPARPASPRSRKGPVIALVVLLLVGAGGWLGYSLLQKGGLPFGGADSAVTQEAEQTETTRQPDTAEQADTTEQMTAEQPASESEQVAEQAGEQAGDEDARAEQDTGTTEKATEKTAEQPGEQAEQVQAAQAEAQQQPQKQQQETVTKKKAAVPPQGHNLLIVANEPCWVESQADDEDMRDFYLRENDKIRLRFRDHLRVRLGNAGGVDLTYDGKTYELNAEKGQVKTLNFPISE